MQTKTFFFPLFLCLCCLSMSTLNVVHGQNLNVGFGKNRVQYHRQQEEWQYYETAHFTTYWYGDARNMAIPALQMAELDYVEIQQLLEYELNERVEMLVFSDLTDLKQSNIGADELFLIRSGETKVSGNKIFVYYDGDHNHLRRSVREGLAGIVINAMLMGGNLQEIVQNSVLLNLPGWYTEGLKAYCGEAWSTERDEQLRNTLQHHPYADFDELARKHPTLAGHAFWQYIAQHFGYSAVSNLLYLTRINRGLDAGFRYVMGNGYDRTMELIFDHYQKRYQEDLKGIQSEKDLRRVKIKNKRKYPIYQLKISPDRKKIAWVQNDIGKWKVWVKDLGANRQSCVLKGGLRNAQQATDWQYPLLAWSPDNTTLGVIFEQRDVVKFAKIDIAKNQKEIKPVSPEFQRIHHFDYINPIDLALSATVRGYTDLYIYHTANRQTERLTQDIWDDNDVSFLRLEGVRYLAFASNRPTDTLSPQRYDTILPLGRWDLFLYNLDTRDNELIRLTQSPFFHERNPIAIDSAHIAWISDETGVDSRHIAYLEDYVAYWKTIFYLKNGSEVTALNTRQTGAWPLEKALARLAPADTVRKNLDSLQIDSVKNLPVLKKRAVSWLDARFPAGLIALDAHQGAKITLLEAYKKGKETAIHLFQPDSLLRHAAPLSIPTVYRRQTLKEAGIELPEWNIPIPAPDTPAAGSRPTDTIPQGWTFQVPEHLRTPSPAIQPDTDTETVENNNGIPPAEQSWNTRMLTRRTKVLSAPPPAITRFNPSRIIPYRLKFRTDFIATDMDNSLLFEGLDSYAASPGGFRTPPPGLLVRANFKELLENYIIEAGFRLPTSFNGSEYYLWLDDRKRRIDRRYTVYRRTTVRTLDGETSNPYQVRYNTVLGQYELRYPFDPYFSLRGMATLRQDKSITLSSNRATLETPEYAEQRAAIRISGVYDNTVLVDANLRTGTRARLFVEAVKRFEFNTQPNWNLKFNAGFMTVINLDARHYQRLDRYSILALRLAGATTFGSERILYYLGGVDNWIIPRFNDKIPVPQNENFAYQTLAAHLRGFRQNIRNGASFALINTELRVPLFKYLLQRPNLGSFWRNFQLVGFFDAGTAWSGSSPYNRDNPINIEFLQNPPTVQVKVNYFRDPLVAGYGAGLRMQLFGLLLRADYAWGIETRTIQKPMLHLALGVDF